MALRCTICTHPAISDIDKALMAGYSFRSLAEQYGGSASALFRHTRRLPRRRSTLFALSPFLLFAPLPPALHAGLCPCAPEKTCRLASLGFSLKTEN